MYLVFGVYLRNLKKYLLKLYFQVTTPTSKRLSGRIDVGQTPKQSDDGCPLREISSVMMTAGGFLSPCREGKLPERGKVPERDPEERQRGPRRHLEETERNSGDFSVNIKQEPGTEIIPPINIKQEAPDVDDMQVEWNMGLFFIFLKENLT